MNTKLVLSLALVFGLGLVVWAVKVKQSPESEVVEATQKHQYNEAASGEIDTELSASTVQTYEKPNPGALPTMPKVDEASYGQHLSKVNDLIANYEQALTDPATKPEVKQQLKAAIADYNEAALPLILAQLEAEQRNQ